MANREGLYADAIESYIDQRLEWIIEYIKERMPYTFGQRMLDKAEMRRMYEAIVQQEGGIETFMNEGVSSGYTEAELMGFLSQQNQKAVRRARRNGNVNV